MRKMLLGDLLHVADSNADTTHGGHNFWNNWPNRIHMTDLPPWDLWDGWYDQGWHWYLRALCKDLGVGHGSNF